MIRNILLLLLTAANLSAFCQVTKTDVLGAYIYNFANLSSSQTQSELPFYNIVLVSEENDVISEFRKMEKEMKIHKKPIKLIIDPLAEKSYNSACLIFIDSDKSDLYPQIFRKTKNSQALLVTENYTDKTQIMLNLYESEHRIKFEMNKGNIYGRGIKIDDEILLMGGSIVDLAEMYVNSQKQLKNADSRLNVVQDSLGELGKQLSENQNKISNQQNKLQVQKNTIDQQKQERQSLNHELKNYKTQINNQKQAYIKSQEKLENFNDSLQQAKNMLNDYTREISNNMAILLEQQQEISNNKKILSQKNSIIETQQNVVVIFSIAITIILVLFFLMLKAFHDKKRKNQQLKKQKKEIEEQYKILEKNKNLIESMMDELGEKNEELYTTLEENKRIQNKLVHSEKMASLGVLSAGIAHEINNPINFVYAGINSLLRDFEDIEPVINEVSNLNVENENLKEKIEYIKQLKEENYFDEAVEAIPQIINDIKLGADRTAEIVKGLRNFTRMDKDKCELLNINSGLDTSLLLLKNKYKNRIEIIKNYDNKLPEIYCFPGKINQAFLNILSNAVDSIEDKGTISVSTEKLDDIINVSIKDSGCGIPNDIQSKIFDPFFTTKSVGEGTGLGLSITFGIIEEHNGTIDVISNENTGSEFIIKLPMN
ncbi:YfiR/HmsC family protein [Plebeiibacterium marinum]|uniref:histidine kinase n=1 Tax=Plebeiibacterium marinum TaxID=2992111 RepID=A0AAE3SLL8_9BACT|nr:YfiR/HmsC family protein [Plebeiobacterium marinum]MCW3808010.1 YfiR/HmsC family protein [Plebeiobacterium marinum]